MAEDQRKNDKPQIRWFLTSADQGAVAVILAACLLISIGYGLYQQSQRGTYIELDRADPVEVPFLVDINSADWPELAQLPGIGETLAKRIVDSRMQDGPFLDRTDIQRVRGIGPRTTEKLLPYMIPVPEMENIAGGADLETKG
ncbi:MAG: hypothetical protein COA78_03380 [Blastopirellula sp.]|nr:MAG: hypothetical protein COA78_03380 [Blastopirellula sp.]